MARARRGVVDCVPMSAASSQFVVGVDVGGTKILAALIEVAGVGATPDLLEREQVATNGEGSDVVERIESLVASLVESAAAAGRPAEAIGVGLPGFVDRRGVARQAPNCPGIVGVDLAGRLVGRTGLPTVIDNDANCAAVMAHHTLAPDIGELVAITLGTGIGGGIVLGGQLLRGATGFAGEPGHMVIDPDGPQCPCGQRGCWERFASGQALGQLARRAVEQGRAPDVLELAGSVDAVRGDHVTALLERGSPGAMDVFKEWIGHVAAGVANLIVLLDPAVIVIGGGVSAQGSILGDLLVSTLAERYPAAVDGREVEILMTPGGPEAGVVGAALLAAYHVRPG